MATRGAAARWWRREVGHRLEAAAVFALYGVCWALPLDRASGFGGWFGRTIGTRLGVTKRAYRNLTAAMPELDATDRAAIVRGMWDNFGRVLAEFPHLRRLWRDDGTSARVTVAGGDVVRDLMAGGGPMILVSAHVGNWEVMPIGLDRLGLRVTAVYRRPNNRFVDGLLLYARGLGRDRFVPKGREGARAVIGLLGKGATVGMLVDQKMNDGIPVPFFGRPAMTAPAVAQLALRYRCPVVPTRTERLGGAHFRVTLYPPLELPSSADRDADIRALMATINGVVEGWVRDRPDQWLWLHRRWPRN